MVFLPDAPKPPDPKETAAAQTGTNVATAIANSHLNNIDQITPDGRLEYKIRGYNQFTDPSTGETFKVPNYVSKTTLSEHGKTLKKLNNKTERELGAMALDQSRSVRSHLSKGIDGSVLPDAGDANLTADLPEMSDLSQISDGESTRNRVEAALMERLDSQLDGDRDRLRAELSNQGLKLGTEAYDRGMEEYGRNLNDARLAAILGAGDEASRVFGMDLSKAQAQDQQRRDVFDQNLTEFNAGNAARDRALDETFAMRNQPINEISALLSGSQVQQPKFGSTPVNKIPTTDFAGIVANNYAQKNAAYQGKLGFFGDVIGGVLSGGAGVLRGA